MRPDFTLRPATPEDAVPLVDLIIMAGDGMPLHVWEAMREPGETVHDVGRRRACRTEGGFSYRNADVAVRGTSVISSVIAYPLDETPEPFDPSDVPPMFRPLLELEAMVPGTWYINVLATYPVARKTGAATALLSHVEARARAAGHERLSIITGDINPALFLYRRFGFEQQATRTIVKGDWSYEGTEWVLLTKDISKEQAA
ncbi:MAG: GNAT family N-acetyltransferase [Pseudomonadota bacterium]